MLRSLSSRVVLVLVIGSLAVFGGAAVAGATTGTGSGGDFAVTVSLAPDSATTGDLLSVGESIANTTNRLQFAWVTQTLTGPGGAVHRLGYPLLVRAGATVSIGLDIRVLASWPRGTYTLALTATNGHGSATASATVAIT